MRYPLLLLSGVWAGCVVAALEYCIFNGLNFYAEAIGFFGGIALPFFVGASYEIIHRNDGSLSAYASGGLSRYFAILLPGAFVAFFGALGVFILTLIFTAFGGGQDDILMAIGVFWVFIPLVFFFFFYDTAAVLEEKKVFASLLRSVAFVRSRPFEVIAFYCACFILLLVLFVVGAFIGSLVLAGSMVFDPSLDINTLLNMTAEEQQALIGKDGVDLVIVLYAVVTGLFTAILLPFKAVFYRRHVQGVAERQQEAMMQEGVYDEKGRWYKYS
ncbi:hypothetical protein L1S32_05185 [Methanogenium sp. S4BF]|uniref:DUF7847 domain-containing protein n=1 Tax=Methanogenium sp. S4BF TaxID=1789226 RepID=UPI002416ACF2|nr:hypothetical protein [Methanogenium sp. S4BF]WFN35498.1 hypothetical protein L1S32_05185 [Methanogenium sp. S4BF]